MLRLSLFRWSSCDGVFCPCGWWCVEMCVFFITGRRFRLWLWCGFLVEVYFVTLLLLSFFLLIALGLSVLVPFLCCFFPWIWDDSPALLGFEARLQNCETRLLTLSCLSVIPTLRPSRPSVYMGQLRPHWTHFHAIWYLSIFKNPVEILMFIGQCIILIVE